MFQVGRHLVCVLSTSSRWFSRAQNSTFPEKNEGLLNSIFQFCLNFVFVLILVFLKNIKSAETFQFSKLQVWFQQHVNYKKYKNYWFARDVIAVMLVVINKRFLINSWYCLFHQPSLSFEYLGIGCKPAIKIWISLNFAGLRYN